MFDSAAGGLGALGDLVSQSCKGCFLGLGFRVYRVEGLGFTGSRVY